MKKIGLGCFHFKATQKMSPEEYIKYLKEDLDKITNISNLKIDIQENSFRSGFIPSDEEIKEENFNFEDATGFFPSFCEGKISFDLFIPKKMQEKALGWGFCYKSNEFFKVEIYFNYYFTFTIIEPRKLLDTEESSWAVVCVREFIKNEIENNKEIRFELEVLGPSPFHGDFEIELLDNSNINTEYLNKENLKIFTKIVPTSSYDLVKINGSQTNFKNEEDFKKFVINELSEEFSLYYLQVLFRNYKLNMRQIIDKLAVKAKSGFGIEWWQANIFRRTSSRIEKLFLKVVELKYYNISFSQNINQRMKDTEREKGVFHLKEFFKIEDDDQEEQQYLSSISDLVDFMDKKQSNRTNNTYLFVTTMVGATLGFILSLILK
ncbi:MAG: hypothetical protein K9M36_02100 [Candidatus Pacebacteria bacterium]|nr:hypothetical protein [Candidatus Paceibacterota bacterium]